MACVLGAMNIDGGSSTSLLACGIGRTAGSWEALASAVAGRGVLESENPEGELTRTGRERSVTGTELERPKLTQFGTTVAESGIKGTEPGTT